MNARAPAPSPAPASIEAEQALLGAVLINQAAYPLCAEHVRADQFSEPLHARIFEYCGDLVSAGRAVTPMSLKPYFDELDLGGMTAGRYLARLAAEAVSIVLAVDYAKIVADMATRRELISRAQEMILAAAAPTTRKSAGAILETCEGALADIRNGLIASARSAVTAGEATERLIAAVEALQKGGVDPSATTGFRDLDRRMGGWRRKRLYIGGGRPGMGKTAFLSASACKAAKKGHGVGIFSLETDEEETAARLVAARLSMTSAPLNYSNILLGRLSAEELEAVRAAKAGLDALPIEIDCASGLSVGLIEARARAMNDRFARKGFRLDVLFVDYLQLVAPGDRYKGSKVAEIGDVVQGFKTIAKRLDMAVVLFSQLSRDVERRDDKRPMKSDLRDSGNIEEFADGVLLFYRPNYYDRIVARQLENGVRVKDLEEGFATLMRNREHDLEVIVDKIKLGQPGTTVLHCRPERSLVEDSERRDFPRARGG